MTTETPTTRTEELRRKADEVEAAWPMIGAHNLVVRVPLPELRGLLDVVDAARTLRERMESIAEADTDLGRGIAIAAALAAVERAGEWDERLTHGRHCPCSACARENWTNPDLAHCGMHGPSCPPVYAPVEAPR